MLHPGQGARSLLIKLILSQKSCSNGSNSIDRPRRTQTLSSLSWQPEGQRGNHIFSPSRVQKAEKNCSILFNSASCTLFILVQLKRCADQLILGLELEKSRKYTVLPPTTWENFTKSFYTPIHNAFKQSIWHQNPKSEMLNISSCFVAKIQHWTLARPVRTKAVFMAASNICG